MTTEQDQCSKQGMAVHTLQRTQTGRQWRSLGQYPTYKLNNNTSAICRGGIQSTTDNNFAKFCFPSCLAWHNCLDKKIFPNAYQGFNGRSVRVLVKEVGFFFFLIVVH